MDKQYKKIIAPAVITALLVVFLVVIMIAWLSDPLPPSLKFIGVIVLLGLIAVSAYVLIERIREIRSGEEDDLGKY